jgi:hypothetical protein
MGHISNDVTHFSLAHRIARSLDRAASFPSPALSRTPSSAVLKVIPATASQENRICKLASVRWRMQPASREFAATCRIDAARHMHLT